MRRSSLFRILIFFISTLTSQSPAVVGSEQKVLDRLIVANNVGISAGFSINGITEWTGAAGMRDREQGIPFTTETITRIASIAKPMTAVAIMQLVEQKQLELDVPIQRYLPDFPEKKKGVVTIRHLLSHTSGIDGYKNSKETETKEQFDNLWEATEVFMKRKLKFTPGTNTLYTTYGYVVLGAIIEEVTGMSFATYMQQNIWDKAGMTGTGVARFNAPQAEQSSLYHNRKGTVIKGVENNLSNRIPGGGIYSNLDDLIRFGNALLDYSLINEDSFAEMMKVQSVKKEGNPYGFGFYLYAPSPNGNVVIGHTGEQTGCSAQLLIHRQDKSVTVVLSNTSGKLKEAFTAANELMNIASDRLK